MKKLRLSVALLMLAFVSFSGLLVLPVHAAPTVTTYQSGNYANECILSANSAQSDDGQHADGGGGFAEASYGTCTATGVTNPSNGVAVLQTITRGSIGVSYHANSSVWFADRSYSVPNVGQDHSWFNFSGVVYLLGYEAADGGGLGYYDSRISLQVVTRVIRDDGKIYGPFDQSITGSSQGGNGCSGSACEASNTSAGIAGLVHSAGWQSFANTYAISGAIRLDNGDLGHSYQVDLYFEQAAFSQAVFATTTGAGGCLEYYKFVSSSFTKGVFDCTGVPVDVNSGNLPQAPNSGGGCPSGSLPHGGNQCFYAQWQFTNYQVANYFSGDPDFSISSGNNSPPITQLFLEGFASQVNVNFASIGGWSGTISLTTSITAPSQSLYGASQAPIVSLSSPSVSMSAGGSSQITLTANASSTNTEPGPYTIAVTGTSGSLQHTTYFDFYVVYQNILIASVTPAGTGFQGDLLLNATIANDGNWYYPSLFVGPGSIYTISFYANRTLFSSVSYPSYGSNCVYFLGQIAYCIGIPPGLLVPIIVDWNSNGWTPGTYTISVSVQPSGGASQNKLAFIGSTVTSQTMTFGGVTAKVSSVFAGTFPSNNTLYGTTTMTETNSTSGASLWSDHRPMTLSSPHFVAQTPNAPSWLAAACMISINSPSSNCSFGKTPDADYDASSTVDVGDLATVAYYYKTAPGDPNWNPKADVTGDGKVDIGDLSTVALYKGWQIFQMTPGIVSLSPTTPFLVVTAGSTNSTNIMTASTNGWAGTATLTQYAEPSGPSCLFGTSATTSVALPAGGTANSGLNCSVAGNLTPRTYSETVVGSNTGLGNSITFPIDVSGFTISANNPSSFYVGSSSKSNLTVSSVFGWGGTVTLTANPSSGVSASCPSVSILKGTSIISTCTFTANTAGTYAITITGTSGGVTQSVVVTVKVTDFSITATPLSLTMGKASTGSSIINVTSIGGFSGNVTLTVSSPLFTSICASSCSGTSAVVTLSSGGWAAATLYLYTLNSTPKNTYTNTVTGTYGSITHAVTITVTVT